MVSTRSVFVLAVCSAAIASPVTAQGQHRARKETALARAVMRDFATCAVRRQHDIARMFVLMPENQRMDDADYRKLTGPECLGMGELAMQRDYFRGALADALVRRDMKGATPKDFSAVPPLVWDVPADAPTVNARTGKPLDARTMAGVQAKQARTVALRSVAQLSECVVRADPAAAKVALDTDVDSAAEIAALKAMSPAIARCVNKGETMGFNRTNLRNAIAISFYRLANSQGASAAAGAKS